MFFSLASSMFPEENPPRDPRLRLWRKNGEEKVEPNGNMEKVLFFCSHFLFKRWKSLSDREKNMELLSVSNPALMVLLLVKFAPSVYVKPRVAHLTCRWKSFSTLQEVFTLKQMFELRLRNEFVNDFPSKTVTYLRKFLSKQRNPFTQTNDPIHRQTCHGSKGTCHPKKGLPCSSSSNRVKILANIITHLPQHRQRDGEGTHVDVTDIDPEYRPKLGTCDEVQLIGLQTETISFWQREFAGIGIMPAV